METDSVHISQTSHASVSSIEHSSHESMDSGYLTLTPHSANHTPMVINCKTRSALSRRYRVRRDPWQCEKIQKYRSKLNHLLNTSESDYLLSQISEQESILEPSCTSINQSLSIVHSTPSCANPNLETGYHEFDEPLESKEKRIWRTTISITPASTNFQILSPPPSPAVSSSSYMASTESIEEDVEMKLIPPLKDIAQFKTSTRSKISVPHIMITPIRKRAGSPTLTTEDNRKLSKLSITELDTISEIKPKRLDFSYRGPIKPTLDYTEREKVDVLSLLGEKSNHWRIVSKILSFLSPQDLCSVCMVSKVWARICENDSLANTRRLNHVLCRQNIKENLNIIRKVKLEENIQTSPKSRHYVKKGYLLDVQNLLQLPLQSKPPNSPPVSPSKVKFHSFVKASRTLAPWQHLVACPRCSFACHVDDKNNIATCSRQGCSIEFCTSCSSKPHTGSCKTPLLATPTKRHHKRLIVGSRQSKRNLRRL